MRRTMRMMTGRIVRKVMGKIRKYGAFVLLSLVTAALAGGCTTPGAGAGSGAGSRTEVDTCPDEEGQSGAGVRPGTDGQTEADTRSGADVQSDAAEILWPVSFINLTGRGQDGWLDFLTAHGADHYEALTANPDGSVTMTAADEDLSYWQDLTENLLADALGEYGDENRWGIVSDDYRELSVFIRHGYDMNALYQFLTETITLCCMRQILDGSGEDYSIDLREYNAITGKLITEGNPRTEDVGSDDEAWELTDRLSASEEARLRATFGEALETYVFADTFYDAYSDIVLFTALAEDHYTYIYINEENQVVLGLTEEEAAACRASLQDGLEQLIEGYESAGENYRIICSDDCSKIECYFDSGLSNQEIASDFMTVETVCMFEQVLMNETDDYYIDFEMYDCRTGALVSTGNTIDGIDIDYEDLP